MVTVDHVLRAAAASWLVVLAGCGSPQQEGGSPRQDGGSPLAPGAYVVNVNDPAGAPGLVFYATGLSAAVDNGKPPPATGSDISGPSSAVITDKSGRVVWMHSAPPRQGIANFRAQTYQGRPVLTWWQGDSVGGHGSGADYLADEHYRVIAQVTPGAGLSSDVHEFRLTPDGRALITSYQEVDADLSAVGGPKNGKVFDCIASVVDVASKTTLFRWDAMSHVPVGETFTPYRAGETLDAYHMNSIALDPAGNLVISMRATSAVYDVDVHDGRIKWQLGGKHSTWTLDKGVQFGYQHDAQMPDPSTVTLFNNDNDFAVDPRTRLPSSLEWIHLDPATRTASLIRNQQHPDRLETDAMGNLQELPNGNTFSGWGTARHISEFTAAGQLVYDVSLPSGTYRAFLNEWQGMPTDTPQLTVSGETAHAVWNGATMVKRWRVLHGSNASTMTPTATFDWNGYDTTMPVSARGGGSYQVEALDERGAVISRSPVASG